MSHSHRWLLLVIVSSVQSPERQLKYYQILSHARWGRIVVVCVFHDNENLFMHAYYFSNFISKYLKCAVKIYFLALPVDCFLLCREKNKDHQSSSTPHGDVHPFSCLSFSDLHQTQTYIAFFYILIRLFHFQHIIWRQMVRFSIQIILGV